MIRILLILFVFTAIPAEAINYFRCDTSSDCVKAYGGCGRYFSVHKRYKELYEAKAHKGDRVANCKKPTAIDQKVKFEGKARCLKNKCLLSLKQDKSDKKSKTK